MAKTIWKYPLFLTETFDIKMPEGQMVTLHVGLQKGKPHVWVLTDDESKDKALYRFYTVGTGEEVPNKSLNYAGTIQMPSGYVWHWFYERVMNLDK